MNSTPANQTSLKQHMNVCYKGWSDLDANRSGRCCCNCVNQVAIYRHPWNTMVGGRMKGPVTQIAGWGCKAMENGGLIFMEDEHSMCEVHEWKKA